jgi:hypothetical protein
MSYWRRIAAALALAVLIIASVNTNGLAQQTNGNGSGLIISPTRTELEISPGKSDKVSITLRNVSGGDITAKAEVNDFESDGTTGEPKIIADPNHQTTSSIKNFLTNLSDVELKKDEKKDFDVGVNIPANTPAGAYYGIIRYTAVTKTNEGGEGGKVSLNASVGTIVLIEAPGNITEQIQVKSVKALQDKKSGSFFLKAPNKVAIDIKNNGNSFSKPFGRVSVNAMGGKEVYSYELNNTDPKANILPGSSRIFTDDLKNISKPGRYTIIANISHGRGGEVITFKASFWYVPAWILITLAVILIALVVGAYVLYRRRFSRPSKRRK